MRLTLSMRSRVLPMMRERMKFSKGPEVTRRQMWNLGPSVTSGTYSSMGRASMAKRMHDFWFLSMSS